MPQREAKREAGDCDLHKDGKGQFIIQVLKLVITGISQT